MTERHNGFRLPERHGPTEMVGGSTGRLGVVVFAPSRHKHSGKLHSFLAPIATLSDVTIVDALPPGRFHRTSDTFVQVPTEG